MVYVHVYDSTLVHIPNVPAWKCDVCGMSLFDDEAIRRIEVLIGEAGPPPNHYTAPREESPSPPDSGQDEPRPQPEP